MNKNRLIIETEDGLVNNVYTDSMEEFDIEITDPEDECDIDRIKERRRVELLIRNGGVREILNGPQDTEIKAEPEFPVADPQSALLIMEENFAKTDTGILLQKVDLAYMDGILTASGMLNKFIRKLYMDKSNDASIVYKALRPLIEKYDTVYDGLCNRLNTWDYDMIAQKSETERE